MQGPRNYQKSSDKPTSFEINIHDPFSAADLRTSGLEIKAGYETTFSITPSEIVATEGVRELAPHRRNCTFYDEKNKLSLFK